MAENLYNIMRPKTFHQMIHNCSTIEAIENDANAGTLKHTYLMTGNRGTGKTSLARIIAKAYDCKGKQKPCDTCLSCKKNETKFGNIVEINAGQFGLKGNAEDTVNRHSSRGLSEGTTTIIMDECHSLTSAAKELLKKPIEEPPAHLKWIFCTDQREKMDKAFLSRCQRHNLDKLTKEQALGLITVSYTEYCVHFRSVASISLEHTEKIIDYSENVPREIIGNVEAYLSGNRNPESLRMYSNDLEAEEDINVFQQTLNALGPTCNLVNVAKIISKFPDHDRYESIRIGIMTTARKRWLATAENNSVLVKKCAIVLEEFKDLLAHPKSVNDFSARIIKAKLRISKEI